MELMTPAKREGGLTPTYSSSLASISLKMTPLIEIGLCSLEVYFVSGHLRTSVFIRVGLMSALGGGLRKSSKPYVLIDPMLIRNLY
jgi:hypothetical protein